MTREERCQRAAALAQFEADHFSMLREVLDSPAGVDTCISLISGALPELRAVGASTRDRTEDIQIGNLTFFR